ncbi:MAG: hypothetical protein AAGJ93_01140 [Bacteroidota bacterium]
MRLTILTIFAWCLIGPVNSIFAQEGGEREFGKKNQQPVVEEPSQEVENEVTSSEEEIDDRPALQPSRMIKGTSESPLSSGKPVKTDSTVQVPIVNPKKKDSKNKYNFLVYYFYKLKHEDSDNKVEE